LRIPKLFEDRLHRRLLYGLEDTKDIDLRLEPRGSLETLIEARDQGLIKHIGCTSHQSRLQISTLRKFDFEIIFVPINFVERESLKALIPLCCDRGVGVTIMKRVAWGSFASETSVEIASQSAS